MAWINVKAAAGLLENDGLNQKSWKRAAAHVLQYNK